RGPFGYLHPLILTLHIHRRWFMHGDVGERVLPVTYWRTDLGEPVAKHPIGIGLGCTRRQSGARLLNDRHGDPVAGELECGDRFREPRADDDDGHAVT